MADIGPPGPRPGPPRRAEVTARVPTWPQCVAGSKSAHLSQDGTAGVSSAGRGPGASGACRSRWAVTRSRRRHWLSKKMTGAAAGANKLVVLRSKAGFPPDLESTRMWEASLENANQPRALPRVGICDIRGTWLQVPSFPRARPRMCRREVWVAALDLIEAHSHTLSSFRRIRL
jgi:hypothetical protein